MDKEQVKKGLEALIEEGNSIYLANIVVYDANLIKDHSEGYKRKAYKAATEIMMPQRAYQAWYDKAYEMVRIFSPRRVEEFEKYYTGNKDIIKTDDLNAITAGIMHYIQRCELTIKDKKIDFFNIFEKNFSMQIFILVGIKDNIGHELFHLESNFQYGLSKSEIEVAKELQKNKHLREAGVIAGLVIELHLRQVVEKRGIKLPTNPTMRRYNEALKGSAYDVTTTKRIELCATIRNKCAHAGGNPPDDYEIDTIISSAEIIIATVS